MKDAPELSVVMSVYGNAESALASINSVCEQSFDDFEFIIINDGSDQETSNRLCQAAEQDSRIKLIHQANQGLTHSLVTGCAVAIGQYIARQDAGDMSAKNRFQTQVAYLRAHPEVSMLSAATRFCTPLQEELYVVTLSHEQARMGMSVSEGNKLTGPPHHGSVMFPRSKYLRVGGYREAFRVAQDLDLWTRLIEVGEHHCLTDVLYQATVEPGSISMRRRSDQQLATQAIVDCIEARAQNASESAVLSELAQQLISHAQPVNEKQSNAAYYYFIGSNLADRDTRRAKHYFSQCLKLNPFHWRAWLKLGIMQITQFFRQ